MAAESLWKRSLSVLLDTSRPTPVATVTTIRARYSLSRRVAAIVVGIELPAGSRPDHVTTALSHESAPKRPPRNAPARRYRPALVLTTAVVTTALVGVVGAVALHRPPALPAASEHPATPNPTGSLVSTAPTSGPPTDNETRLSAQDHLQEQVHADRLATEALVGSWVPEVSAKRLGLVAGGVVYDYQNIWADYRRLSSTYPKALLLKSEAFTTFGQPDYWVTVIATPFSSAADANAWCDSRKIGPSDCLAARLTHEVGSKGNTVTRDR